TQLFIPSNQQLKSCSLFCGNHGKCISYINKKILYFCQCDQRYSGNQCHIKHNCSCSSDSYCLTSSICICPIYKFGQNCYLKHLNCQLLNKSCENNGLCIPNDDRIAINSLTCLCQENFVGNKCEKNIQSRVDLEFDEDLIQRESLIFAHFITTFENSEHQSITTLYKIKYGINIITIYIKQPFHILLIEFSNHNYYLTVLREIFIQSEYIKTKIQLNNRCNSIQQIMNSTFQTYSYLHRIKYYPYFCRQYKELMCFYDENYMCLCQGESAGSKHQILLKGAEGAEQVPKFSYASVHSTANRKKNILPEDIFNYNNDLFYEFIKQAYGSDIAELFSFQAIRNAALLLDTSCEDILLVLQQESDDIDALKKMCCFKVAGNKHQVKLGVKLAINNLIQSLKLKQEQSKKRKRSSNQGLSSNINAVTPINQAQIQNTVTPLKSTLSSSSTTGTSSIQSALTPMQRKLDELGHTADIEERINRWWIINNDDEHASLEQGVDYFLAINKSSSNIYTCVLSCKCHTRFKLPFMTPGFFKISSSYRHLKEKQCMQLLNVRPEKENDLLDGETSNQSKAVHNVSKSSRVESQQAKKVTHTITSKRIRSPSIETSSDRHGVIKKRIQNFTSSTMQTSQE
ncbi:unnamed protein product, partial [Rotaria sp. Silwood2]